MLGVALAQSNCDGLGVAQMLYSSREQCTLVLKHQAHLQIFGSRNELEEYFVSGS